MHARQFSSNRSREREIRGERFGDTVLDARISHVLPTLTTSPCGTSPNVLLFEPACGWGDQLRGLVTSFYLSLMTCRTLKQHWPSQIVLERYFLIHVQMASPEEVSQSQPNKIDLVNKFDFLQQEEVMSCISATNSSVYVHTNAYQWREVVYYPEHRAMAELYGLAGLTRYELYNLAMRVLMPKPSERIRRAVNEVLVRSPHWPIVFGSRRTPLQASDKVIGVQIRTGGVGENWTDDARDPLSSVHCFAHEVRRICGERNCTVFLTTDSQLATSEFKKMTQSPHLRLTEWRGQILHTALHSGRPSSTNQTESTDIWEKTFVDWTALSQVDVLLMSKSGFAWTAAWAGPVPYARQLLYHGHTDTCSWRDFDKSWSAKELF